MNSSESVSNEMRDGATTVNQEAWRIEKLTAARIVTANALEHVGPRTRKAAVEQLLQGWLEAARDDAKETEFVLRLLERF